MAHKFFARMKDREEAYKNVKENMKLTSKKRRSPK